MNNYQDLRRAFFSAAALFFAVFASTAQASEPAAPSVTSSSIPEIKAAIDKAIAAVYPALVRIEAVLEEGGDGRMRKEAGVGSGTIISPDGYVLTNHHVAGRATRLTCQL